MSLAEVLLLVSLAIAPIHTSATYYGADGDGFLGKHHGAYWHGKTPPGFSDVVDMKDPGVAMSSQYGIEYGQVVVICVDDPAYELWCGRCVLAVRVDAKPGRYVDLYASLFDTLTDGHREVGVIKVKVFPLLMMWGPGSDLPF